MALPELKHDIGYSVYDAISHLRVNLIGMASAKGPVACALEKLTFFNIKAKLNALSFPEPPPPPKKAETTTPMTVMTVQLRKGPDRF